MYRCTLIRGARPRSDGKRGVGVFGFRFFFGGSALVAFCGLAWVVLGFGFGLLLVWLCFFGFLLGRFGRSFGVFSHSKGFGELLRVVEHKTSDTKAKKRAAAGGRSDCVDIMWGMM